MTKHEPQYSKGVVSFSYRTCKVGRPHSLPQKIHTTGVWAGPPVGLAACSHFTLRLGSKLTFSTGLAMLLIKTNTFLERFFTALFTRSIRYACKCAQVNLHSWVHMCQYLFISPFNSQEPQCGFDYIETSLRYIQRNCQPTIESMQNHFFSHSGPT